jgi:pimeloyl-ACP methyl ester carboxylesterase
MKRSRGYRRRTISSTTWTMLLLSLIIIALLVLVTLSIMNRPEIPVPATPETSLPTDTPQPTPTRRPTAIPPTPTPSIAEPTSSATGFSPFFVTSDCRFTLPQAANVTCGVVAVPADREANTGSTIRLAVAIFHSTSRSPAQDPVLYLHNNPGGSSSTASALQWAAINFENFVLPILEKRDLIVFDLRGSGLSVPNLDCPEAITVYRRDSRGDLTVVQRRAAYMQALETCRSRLASYGINPAHYTTQASAADAKDIIQALGFEQVNLFGAAYGALLGQNILRDSPDLIRSAVFDSPIPLEINYYNEAAARYDRALIALFETCAADPTCAANYPDLETVYETLTSSLDESPVAVTIQGEPGNPDYEKMVDGSTLSSTLISAMNASFYTSNLPKLIFDLSQGNIEESRAFIQAALSIGPVGALDLSAGMRFAADCHEQIYATTPEELMESQATHPRTQALGEQAILGNGETLFALCDVWDAAPFDPNNQQPITADTPALILAGQIDPITSAYYGKSLTESLPNSYLLEVPGAGHTPSLDQRLTCPFSQVLGFLDLPGQPPDPACLEETQISFYVPYTGEPPLELLPVQIPEMEIQGLAPEGWTDLGQGVFSRQAIFEDDTRLEIRSSNERAAAWLAAMIAGFDGIGFDRTPARTNTRYTNGVNWSIYRAFSEDRPVDLALGETGGRTLLVLLLSQPAERDAMYRTVFLPAIDGTTP